MKREQGTRGATPSKNPCFAKARSALAADLPVAGGAPRRDISHRVSTAFRTHIAIFG
jgi:hypothetical protein